MRVLVPGDLHAPAIRDGYLDFLCDVREKYKTNMTVQIGDVADFHNTSFHPREVDAPGVRDERQQTIDQLAPFHAEFKNAYCTLGNHCKRLWRKGASAFIAQEDFKPLSEILHMPTWKFVEEIEIDGVLYFHGTGYSGRYAAFNAMRSACQSVVIGHVHSAGGFGWLAGPNGRMFGMNTGCGVDRNHTFMQYGRYCAEKPILGCAVILDGEPHHICMPCSPGEKYSHRKVRKWKTIKRKKK